MTEHELPTAFASTAMRRRIELVADSYKRLTGSELVETADDAALALWNAPSAIVAHGTGADPIFFFGNRTALDLFACTVDRFTTMPSRLSAEPLARQDRLHLLQRVLRDGFIADYAGVRISATGRRFRIERATVWNLIDEAGQLHGQAATFDRWTELA